MKLFSKLKQLFCIHDELVILPGYDLYMNSSDMYARKLSRKYVLECKKCGRKIVMVKRWDAIDKDISDCIYTKLRCDDDNKEIFNTIQELINKVNNNSESHVTNNNQISRKANMYSILYDIDIEKFDNADNSEVELVVLREFLKGERYILDEEKIKTEEEENKYKYEIGHNRAIEKAIKMIDEITNSKFVDIHK